MPFDLVALTPMAASAVALITPYLSAALTKAADAAGAALGKTAFEKIGSLISSSKATAAPRAQEALEDLRKAPEDDGNAADFRKQLLKLLQEDAAVAEALQAWLKEHNVQPAGGGQTVTGNNNKVSQISGSAGATVTIS